MSEKPTSRELHDQHTDTRNLLRATERHEQRIREREQERMARRMLPLLDSEDDWPDDFCDPA